MDELLEKLKATKWWTILKALPFDGGPSSTRWVFLGGFMVASLCLVMLASSLVVVYVRSSDHHVDSTLCLLVGSTITAILGFASNTQNLMHKLGAQQDPGPQGTNAEGN